MSTTVMTEPSTLVQVRRLGVGDRDLAHRLFAVMAEVLEETIGLGDVFVPVDSTDAHALDFYRALGGVPAPVTIFTFSDGPP